MLDAVVENFLDSVSERALDAPLMALLRAQGFTQIHFTHGPYEHGKDIIARNAGEDTQYAFQSKAGNLALGGWNGIQGQVNLLRTSDLSHPSFSTELPRVAVLVLTGRLVGGATLAVQEYKEQAIARGEPPLEVWDRETLMELLVTAPDAGLAGTVEGHLLELLGHIDSHRVTESEIESFSRRWEHPGQPIRWRSILEGAIVADRLHQNDRADLACYSALALLRALWASIHGIEPLPPEAAEQADVIRGLFIAYADEIWSRCSEDLLSPRALIAADAEGLFVTYPVRCTRLVEILGLYGLCIQAEACANDVAAWLAAFLRSQPGAAHPVSDRWAVSLIPPALLVTRNGHDVAESYLREAVRWLGDRYDNDGLGLASVDAGPLEEAEYLMGSPLEHIDRHRSQSSHLAAVLLDLAAVLELSDIYDVAFNDISAVDVAPIVTVPRDDIGQYLLSGAGVSVPRDTSPGYSQRWADGDEWRMAPHHRQANGSSYLGRLGRPWDQLAITAVTRDRYWIASLRALATPSDRLT